MVVGIKECAISLGATIGPIFGGAVTDATDYSWMLTVLAGVTLLMVCAGPVFHFSIFHIIVNSCFILFVKVTGFNI